MYAKADGRLYGKDDAGTEFLLSSSASSAISVTQASHGLAVGNVIRMSGTTYAKAQADSAANAEVVGMVSAVADADNFSFITGGLVSGLSGLTAGTVYFLSPTTAGALTATEPATAGQVSKPVLVATTTTAGVFYNFRGAVLSSDPGSSVSANSANGLTTTVVHGLGTRNVAVSVRRATAPYDIVEFYAETTDVNTVVVDFTDIGGTTSGEYVITILSGASVTEVNVAPIPFEQGYTDDGDKTGATTVALSVGNVHRVRLTGNVTFTFTGATAGKASSLTLILVQDGTGSRLVTWPASVKWDGGAPVLSTGANKVDIVTFLSVDGGTTWYGMLGGKDFA
jgi:hypothetical protein